MALVFNSSMQYEEDQVEDDCLQEAEENNILELARVIPYLCSNTMNPVWQVSLSFSLSLSIAISGFLFAPEKNCQKCPSLFLTECLLR